MNILINLEAIFPYIQKRQNKKKNWWWYQGSLNWLSSRVRALPPHIRWRCLDFQIKSVGWAIECLRDGNGLNEHIKRFQPPDGKYYRWVKSGEVQEYIYIFGLRKWEVRSVLSTQDLMNANRSDNMPFLFFVVFLGNYAGYEIYDAKLNVVQERIVLLK